MSLQHHSPKNKGTKKPRPRGTNEVKNKKDFQTQDIRSLIYNQGKARLGGQEWCLKTPSWSDSTLQSIINDPKLTARSINNPGAHDRLTFELCGYGKIINVTIGR